MRSKRDRRLLPAIFGKGRTANILLLASLATGQAIAAGIAAFATRDVFAALRDESAVLPVIALGSIASAGVAIAVLRFYERIVAEKIGQDYAATLRVSLFRHLTRVSSREVDNRRTGGLSMRFVGDLAAVRGWVSLGVSRMISASVVLPISTAVLFLLNPSLGLAASIPVLLGLVCMMIIGPRLGPAHRRLRARRARLAADMIERIPHAPELNLLGRINTETQHLLKRSEAMIVSALERARGAATLRAIPDAVSGFAAMAVLLIAHLVGVSGAEVAGALAAVGLMIQPMRDLAGVWDRHRAWMVARDKCEKLLAVPRLPRRKLQSGSPLPDTPQTLRFDEVSSATLKSVTVSAGAGRKIAIVGANGAGKSSLLMLAAGLEKPAKGTVRLGDRPLASLDTGERRRTIALVGSRSPILSGSLRRALTMGAPGKLDDATILAAAEDFGLAKVVDRLGGLQGKVAEAGRSLSAGELRRVLLTRAALSNPKLLLLDEPDDALDADGPALVQQLISSTDATTLMVTHNLPLAKQMDELWFIDNGEVLEFGEPGDLLTRHGPTRRFFERRVAA